MYKDFEENFNKKDLSIYEVVDGGMEKHFGATMMADNSVYDHDSYGNTNDYLEKVYHIPQHDCYVKFTGTTQSYNGTEWDGMKEVKPAEKTVQYFEEL